MGVSASGKNLTITTSNGAGLNHSALNWQSFSVPAGSVTRFEQPSAASTSINRVTGADPSAILGTLTSNGKLVLVNPAGIAVGPGGVVDTAGFTASTPAVQMATASARSRSGEYGIDHLAVKENSPVSVERVGETVDKRLHRVHPLLT